MRLAELAFLVLMVLYHAVLLVPRHRRFLAANYLIFVAGLALGLNLALEGLRWQTLLPILLFFLDLAILAFTFRRLKGTWPQAGLGPLARRFGRSLTASAAFLGAAASLALAVAFPLPQVDLTGGLAVSYREVRFPPTVDRPGLRLQVWYPASGDRTPLPRPGADAETWQRQAALDGLPVYWQAYRSLEPSNLIRGGRLASPKNRYPVVYVALPQGLEPTVAGYQWEDLASRGLVVAAASALPPPARVPVFAWDRAAADLAAPWVNPDLWWAQARRWTGPADQTFLAAAGEALAQLDDEPGDLFYEGLDLQRTALWMAGSGPGPDQDLATRLHLRGLWRSAPGPQDPSSAVRRELWATAPGAPAPSDVWTLEVAGWKAADAGDGAYLEPLLAWVGLKGRPDSGLHGALRHYQAAFFQWALWGEGDVGGFGQSVPEVPGITLQTR